MKRSKKEILYLRALTGEDGTGLHYWGKGPTREQMREARKKMQQGSAGHAAAQVKQMRSATGGKKATTAREKARAVKQVAEMRAAASLGALAVSSYLGNGLTREQIEDIKARNGIGREDANYINPARL